MPLAQEAGEQTRASDCVPKDRVHVTLVKGLDVASGLLFVNRLEIFVSPKAFKCFDPTPAGAATVNVHAPLPLLSMWDWRKHQARKVDQAGLARRIFYSPAVPFSAGIFFGREGEEPSVRGQLSGSNNARSSHLHKRLDVSISTYRNNFACLRRYWGSCGDECEPGTFEKASSACGHGDCLETLVFGAARSSAMQYRRFSLFWQAFGTRCGAISPAGLRRVIVFACAKRLGVRRLDAAFAAGCTNQNRIPIQLKSIPIPRRR
jgi:hypothetical protein